jgi:hypothetical protein
MSYRTPNASHFRPSNTHSNQSPLICMAYSDPLVMISWTSVLKDLSPLLLLVSRSGLVDTVPRLRLSITRFPSQPFTNTQAIPIHQPFLLVPMGRGTLTLPFLITTRRTCTPMWVTHHLCHHLSGYMGCREQLCRVPHRRNSARSPGTCVRRASITLSQRTVFSLAYQEDIKLMADRNSLNLL